MKQKSRNVVMIWLGVGILLFLPLFVFHTEIHNLSIELLLGLALSGFLSLGCILHAIVLMTMFWDEPEKEINVFCGIRG
jgi:hypothetical protein